MSMINFFVSFAFLENGVFVLEKQDKRLHPLTKYYAKNPQKQK